MSNDFDIFDFGMRKDFGDVHIKVDPATGLKAIVAVHNTVLGPALGGCRFKSYSEHNEAIYDAMRLARGMSFKSALADLPLGGGKSVIIEPEGEYERVPLLRAFGRFLNELRGRYITAVDVGTSVADMDVIHETSMYVTCTSAFEGAGPSNPSSITALGVKHGIRAALMQHFGSADVSGRHIAIQGVGSVGMILAEMLHTEGAKLTVSDVDADALAHCKQNFGAEVVEPDAIHRVPCDLFAPCALGGGLSEAVIAELQTPIVAGAANNQLATMQDGQRLLDRGILYAPDYVINAGGIIHVAYQYQGKSYKSTMEKVSNIYQTTLEILSRATSEHKPPGVVAEEMAQEKIAAYSGVPA